MREIERAIGDDDLQAYIDDCLDPARLPEIEAHLAAHPEVTRRVDAYRRQRHDLRQAFAEAMPPRPDADQALLRRVDAYLRGKHQRRLLAAVAMIAVVIGAGLGGGSGWLLRGVTDLRQAAHEVAANEVAGLSGIAALADEAGAAHVVFSADRKRPVEMDAAHQADLTRWLSNRLAHPVAPVDLAAAGFRFMGGRLVATAHGPAALFMYDDDKGTRLSLLIRPMAKTDMEAPLEAVKAHGVDGYAWAQHGIGFSLVGAADDSRLQQLATEAQRQSTGI
ncbi:MAG TPA: anti-sigma factor [Dongiaceae bacterium]|nr:anti-sigma factor [Dongiaceae bacterium]